MTAATRVRTTHRCADCGATAPKWTGRCDGCGAWNSIHEELDIDVRVTDLRASGGPARPIAEVPLDGAVAMPTGMSELDRVLSGGLVPGSVTVMGGEPGVGKS
ncbi:MAG TPA: DNA repair protein RadA, partial [Microthrixaceae bacterium]|nr:DNA repair protein RadA [Microthrixaceae bacterium]